MKKIFPLILVLLFMLISSVSAEEEIVNLAAVYHADGSITLIDDSKVLARRRHGTCVQGGRRSRRGQSTLFLPYFWR